MGFGCKGEILQAARSRSPASSFSFFFENMPGIARRTGFDAESAGDFGPCQTLSSENDFILFELLPQLVGPDVDRVGKTVPYLRVSPPEVGVLLYVPVKQRLARHVFVLRYLGGSKRPAAMRRRYSSKVFRPKSFRASAHRKTPPAMGFTQQQQRSAKCVCSPRASFRYSPRDAGRHFPVFMSILKCWEKLSLRDFPMRL